MQRQFKLYLVFFSALLITACGGGGSTEQLPQTNVTGQATYTGPAPATADIQNFMVNLWENVRPGNNRCGECHSNGGAQAPLFARDDNVNDAYAAANALVDRLSPVDSRLVTKVAGGHNCWLANNQACADIMTTWIEGWLGAPGGSAGRQIQLQAPVIKPVEDSKHFPATSGETIFGAVGGVYELLRTYCADCHSPAAATPQTPYFADSDIDMAYAAVQPKIDLNDPANSRLVVRLREDFHECWMACDASAAEMQSRIAAMADSSLIPPTPVEAAVISRALSLYDGVVASGGNRYETHQIALYEFKAGTGQTAFDTSGVDPAIDLTLSPSPGVTWIGGWGIDIKNGKAQGSTSTSRKLHDLIQSTGEYSIETWVVPANVVQEDTRIISYSASTTLRNFNLGQTLYNYDFFNRSSMTDANGSPALSTADADEVLQATLQHVVVTYDPINGRRIYVNGEDTGEVDASVGGTLADWDNTFALVLGNEVSGNRQWTGQLRLVSIHNRALTQAQIQQNLDVGVGEKFFLLFFIGHLINVPDSYILFEVSEFDNFSYLFNQPVFISLDPTAVPANIPLQGMRIGINGLVPEVGQAYRNLNVDLNTNSQALSPLGTVIAQINGPDVDEFFLSFEVLGGNTDVITESGPLIPPPPANLAPASDIGLRTFDAISATMSEVTGIPVDNPNVQFTFDTVRQSLPAISKLETFVSSHEMGVAQLSIEYCSALVDDTTSRNAYFPGFGFNSIPSVAFAGTNRDLIINPLIKRIMGVDSITQIETQPDWANVRSELGYVDDRPTTDHVNLIDRLTERDDSSAARTANITKAVCAAVLGNAALLIQ
jgi:hypothetical protein